jgi:type II secretory pathway pseudopilin PulG
VAVLVAEVTEERRGPEHAKGSGTMVWVKRFIRDGSGFTVVELVVAAAILFFVSTAIMGALAYASTANASNAMRQAGLELANQRMEQARNLPYDSLGTTNGYPTGTIVTPETVVVTTPDGNKTFVVVTEVGWAVDTVTGLAGDKNVKITVSWASPRSASVTIASNVVGKSAVTNAGDVKINVVDADTSEKVAGATITIKPAGGLQVSSTTGTNGYVYWGKIPAGTITITGVCATHYLDMSPVSGASVLNGQLNEWTVQGVRASSGTVHVTDQSGGNLSGVAVTITGPAGSTGWSCPSGTGTVVTDENGNAVFPKLRKGTYTVTGVLSGYGVQASPPSLSIIAGGNSYTSQLRMDLKTTMKVTVLDGSNNPISGATVSATGPSAVTFASTTDASGQATSNDMGAIGTGKTYTVTASRTGYTSSTGTVTMSQSTQGAVTIKLSPVPPTTIKVTVLDASNNPIPGATVSASGVTFASVTDASGQEVSDDMGAIGTNKTYTVTATKSGYITNTGTVTFSQYTQGALTIKLSLAPVNGTLRVTYSSSLTSSKTIYVYTSNTLKGVHTYSQVVTSGTNPVSFDLPAGTYWVSRATPFGGTNGTTYSPKQAVVTSGNITDVSISSSN